LIKKVLCVFFCLLLLKKRLPKWNGWIRIIDARRVVVFFGALPLQHRLDDLPLGLAQMTEVGQVGGIELLLIRRRRRPARPACCLIRRPIVPCKLTTRLLVIIRVLLLLVCVRVVLV
jgi:hypothetical protein